MPISKNLAARGAALALGLAPTVALAHPHVFVDARMEIVGGTGAELASIRNIWRFDELFSSSVVVDFDKNGNGTLDPDELEAVGETVRGSIAEWSYYTFLTTGGRDVKLAPPATIRGLYDHGQITLFFEMKPAEPVDLARDKVTFSVFDESYFVAFDFPDAQHFQLLDLPASCRQDFSRPDPDADAEDWMAQVSMLKPNQQLPSDGVNFAEALATKVDVTCAP
ncbi:DUF1007 family protein [Aureimonas jatrophae]|uniref:ABC-type uncharacterized transport system, substrate-binding protein n=1 Tax=Aureimonas jatrophae TaxID=1166073 RepID=A0A1H0J7U9_9HYPH|nr:DUF1007 family protein [Aureimonas jatrophae]MBB3951565.1 ABC-type uncharacterized transport system substrate-binding protein [Aureimonas jatrophae]SDO39411.1 ABC-type uncharacterized transport system, substrate-binding protein [Aureimonas jatrophae]